LDYHTLRRPLLFSLLAALLTIGIKFSAYLITGSAGLLSDALESLVNLLAAIAALFSLWYSQRPADAEHTYGHLKIEFFSSGLEGALVAVAGVVTVAYAIRALILPEPLQQLDLGVFLAVVASVINYIVAWQLLRVGKKYKSIVLEADGHHLMSDVLTTVGVVIGLGLVALTGWSQLDALLALGVGLHILWTGFKLIRRSFDGLMDRAPSEAEVQVIRLAIDQYLPTGAKYHFLRTRRAGSKIFVDFHLLIDGGMAVRDAHALAHTLDDQLVQNHPELVVTIHIEPIDEHVSYEQEQLKLLGEVPSTAIDPTLPIVAPPIDD
jgi:cation diffusion facilitator family transporter